MTKMVQIKNTASDAKPVDSRRGIVHQLEVEGRRARSELCAPPYAGVELAGRARPRQQQLPSAASVGAPTRSITTTARHLHMVVLNRKGASYWVVNSLLDRLSNETMLAIAKGLRPINKASTS